MCLTVLEISFLVAGVALIFTGKVPNRVFQWMFGKGEYWLPPLQARLLGLVLASAVPLVFLVSLMLLVMRLENATVLAGGFEIGYDVLVGILALIIARRIRKPAAPPQPTFNPPS